MSNTFSRARDLTAQQRPVGGGMSHYRTSALCNHKGTTTGAQYRRGIGWLRCAACNTSKESK